MAGGKKPDYRVLLPVSTGEGDAKQTVWHRLGVAWKRDNGSIGLVLDVGTTIILRPRAELVLLENTDKGEERQPGDEPADY